MKECITAFFIVVFGALLGCAIAFIFPSPPRPLSPAEQVAAAALTLDEGGSATVISWHGHILALTAAHCIEEDNPCTPRKHILHGRQTKDEQSSLLFVSWCGSSTDPYNCDVAVLVPVTPLPDVRPIPLDDNPYFQVIVNQDLIATGAPRQEVNIFSRGYVASATPFEYAHRDYLLIHGDFSPGSSGSGVYTTTSPPHLLGLIVRGSAFGRGGTLLCETKAAVLYALNAWEQGVP